MSTQSTVSDEAQRKAQQSLCTKKKVRKQQAYLYDILGCPLDLFQAFQDHFFIGRDVQLVGFQVFDLLLYSVGGEDGSGDNTTACTPPLQRRCGNIMNDDGWTMNGVSHWRLRTEQSQDIHSAWIEAVKPRTKYYKWMAKVADVR